VTRGLSTAVYDQNMHTAVAFVCNIYDVV